jgi:hypothetical protein
MELTIVSIKEERNTVSRKAAKLAQNAKIHPWLLCQPGGFA